MGFPFGKELAPFDETSCKAEELASQGPEELVLLIKSKELAPFVPASFKAEKARALRCCFGIFRLLV